MLGLALGGIPAVLIAAFVVKSLDLVTLRWGVVVVVLYASLLLLRAAFVGEKDSLVTKCPSKFQEQTKTQKT